MARVTVEDCIDKVDSPYELVLVAKERATQLNSGIEPTLDRDNDKNTVISLREIAEEKIQVSQEDLAELSETAKPDVDVSADDETTNEQGEVSLDEVSEQENQEAEAITEDSDASNS